MNTYGATHPEYDGASKELSNLFVELSRLAAKLADVGAEYLALCGGKSDELHRLSSEAASHRTTGTDLSQRLKCRLIQLVVDAIAEPDRGDTSLAARAVRIDHVAIAVRDLASAIASLASYGFEVIERRTVEGAFSGMESATVRAGGVTLVLCQGDSPRSNVSQYIEAYGPGVQHLAIQVSGLEQLVFDLSDRGADLLTGIVHAPGLNQTFTRRNLSTGMQFEFLERTTSSGFNDANVRELFSAMEREGVF